MNVKLWRKVQTCLAQKTTIFPRTQGSWHFLSFFFFFRTLWVYITGCPLLSTALDTNVLKTRPLNPRTTGWPANLWRKSMQEKGDYSVQERIHSLNTCTASWLCQGDGYKWRETGRVKWHFKWYGFIYQGSTAVLAFASWAHRADGI